MFQLPAVEVLEYASITHLVLKANRTGDEREMSIMNSDCAIGAA
jgi:hypothetical protein